MNKVTKEVLERVMPMSGGNASQAEAAASTQPLGKEQQEASVGAVERYRESQGVISGFERDQLLLRVN